MNGNEEQIRTASATAQPDLSTLAITLLKGVIYREGDGRLWAALLALQVRLREYMAVLGLDLIVDEAEGYAFLKGRPDSADDGTKPEMPRLVARRPLSFPVSLLLALLRKKLAEFDASGGDTRLVLTRDDIAELMRVFMPQSTNEAKVMDQLESNINRIVDLGFLKRLTPATGSPSFEVRRILKAFVDAQWLADLDARLKLYQEQLSGVPHSTADE
jgi:hypothetical protein